MKFLFLLSVIVVAAVIYFYFFGNLNQSIYLLENSNSSSSAARTNQTPLNKNSAGPGSPASSGFKGPTGKPHIIGPSGPPPNY